MKDSSHSLIAVGGFCSFVCLFVLLQFFELREISGGEMTLKGILYFFDYIISYELKSAGLHCGKKKKISIKTACKPSDTYDTC